MLLSLFVSIWGNISSKARRVLAVSVLTSRAPSASFPRGAVGKALLCGTSTELGPGWCPAGHLCAQRDRTWEKAAGSSSSSWGQVGL